MEEALKCLEIGPKILARKSNALWVILLATDEEAKQLAGSTLATKSVRLQTEYIGTRRKKVTSMVAINGNRLGALFCQVRRGGGCLCKSEIATGDFVLQVILTHKSFGEIPTY